MAQKRLPSQRRGSARPKYVANKKIGITDAKYLRDLELYDSYEILDFKISPLRTALLAKVRFSSNTLKKEDYLLATNKSFVGQEIILNSNELGAIKKLKDIPEGTVVYNIEKIFGDGGKFCRSGSTKAIIRQKEEGKVFLKMPSKVVKEFNENCRATIGFSAGGDRKQKPLLKAGSKFHAVKRRCIEWPFVSRNSKNCKDHRFGGSGKKRPGGPTSASRHAPPGRKVGHIAPKRTGRSKK